MTTIEKLNREEAEIQEQAEQIRKQNKADELLLAERTEKIRNDLSNASKDREHFCIRMQSLCNDLDNVILPYLCPSLWNDGKQKEARSQANASIPSDKDFAMYQNEFLNAAESLIKETQAGHLSPETLGKYLVLKERVITGKKNSDAAEKKNKEEMILTQRRILEEREKERALELSKRKESFKTAVNQFISDNNSIREKEFLSLRRSFNSSFDKDVKLSLGYKPVDYKGQSLINEVSYWDLGHQNVLLLQYHSEEDQSEEEKACMNFVKDLLMEALYAYPIESIKFACVNPLRNTSISSFFGTLKNTERSKLSKMIFFRPEHEVAVKREEIRSVLEAVSDESDRRNEMLGDCDNVLDFNSKHHDSALPLIFILLDGYNESDYPEYKDSLSNIFSKGGITGIYPIVLERDNAEEGDDYGGKAPDPQKKAGSRCLSAHLTGIGNNRRLLLKDGKELLTDLETPGFKIDNALNEAENKLNNIKSFIPLTSLFDEFKPHGDFSEVISIPIGKSGSSVVTIDFDSRSTGAHAAIAGKSGSGKSSLLQNIVLGGARFYSPSELNFWLLDFKDGTSLSHFASLKHVKFVSMKNRSIDAEEIVAHISREMERRGQLIQQLQAGDIGGYNSMVSKDKRLPRLIIIIDEYQQMARSASKSIEMVAKQGRSYGISLVLCSQTLDSGAEEITQCGHYFEFINEHVGSLIKSCTDEDKDFVNTGVKGSCLYKSSGKVIRMIDALANTSNDFQHTIADQKEMIKEINDQYPSFPAAHPLITGSPKRLFRKPKDMLGFSDTVLSDYKSSRRTINVPIGEDRFGNIYNYSIRNTKPVLFLFGDEKRAASLEFSICSRFYMMHDKEEGHGVYYLDFNTDIDRGPNVMAESKGKASALPGINYAKNGKDYQSVIGKLYSEYLRRKEAAESGDSEGVGLPVEVVIHIADNILLCLENEREGNVSGSLSEPDYSKLTVASDDDAFLDGIEQGQKTVIMDESHSSSTDMLKTVLAYGKDLRIFTSVYISNLSSFMKVKSAVMDDGIRISDLAIIPEVPEKKGISKFSGKPFFNIIADTNQSSDVRDFFNRDDFTASDMIYCYLIDNSLLHKLIPYEYEKEK